MSDFSLDIIGCGSATPSLKHNPSGQVVQHHGRLFVVDCGEGSQLQMRRMKIKMSMLRHIFISHLHGDHLLGLPGLLGTLSLLGVEGQVHVYTFPEGIEWLKEFQRMSYHQSSIKIVYHPIRREHALLYEDDRLTVESFPLYHGVPCVGYIFREKPKLRALRGDMANFYNIPNYMRSRIKEGADFVTADGTVIANDRLTLPPPPSYSYAYCSDTAFSTRTIEVVRGVHTLYHEATYADDKKEQARARGHSTAREAAIVAREAGVKRLILGHFSQSYTDTERHLREALEEFPNVIIANEGMTIPLDQ